MRLAFLPGVLLAFLGGGAWATPFTPTDDMEVLERSPARPSDAAMTELRRLRSALAAEPDVPSALKRFEAERLSVGRRIIERARHLGAYLQATQTAEERARSERHSNAQAVLGETAVLDFLHA